MGGDGDDDDGQFHDPFLPPFPLLLPLIPKACILESSPCFISSIAESVSKSGIKLRITTYEARTKYSYTKMKNFVSSLELVPEDYIENRPFYDRFTSLRFTTNNTRNSSYCIYFWSSIFAFRIQGKSYDLPSD
jgi:hypothetical protein